MLTINDVVKDYHAVMTSIEHLQKMYESTTSPNKELDAILFNSVKQWITKDWPFKKLHTPGEKLNGKNGDLSNKFTPVRFPLVAILHLAF